MNSYGISLPSKPTLIHPSDTLCWPGKETGILLNVEKMVKLLGLVTSSSDAVKLLSLKRFSLHSNPSSGFASFRKASAASVVDPFPSNWFVPILYRSEEHTSELQS